MNYETIRRYVEEEVLKQLSKAPVTKRVRRPVVSEEKIVAAWRRGSRLIKVTPGSIITPAARDRAGALGVEIREELIQSQDRPENRATVEAVMAAVIAELERRPRAEARRIPSKKLITAADVEYYRMKAGVVQINKQTKITPLARDLARRYGVKFEVIK